MKDPVDHILRPQLPWRENVAITECGLNARKVPAITRDVFEARLRDLGQQRTAMLTCMTCDGAARRWGTWADDPRKAVEREIQWETARRRNDHGDNLRDELLAIAALIDAHPDEFASYLSETERRREWVERKAANAAKPKQPRPRPLGLL